MNEKIIIFDFGSQYTQLIARRIRELNVYCEIYPYHHENQISWTNVKGVILSGSPASVLDSFAPSINLSHLQGRFPLLGICYGAQLIAQRNGGKVAPSNTREYGRAKLQLLHPSPLFKNISNDSQVWMSHGDSIVELPPKAIMTAKTNDYGIAAYEIRSEPTFCLQFHPEVTHSIEGTTVLKNFVIDICGCRQDWTPDSFVDSTVAQLKQKLGQGKVVMALSGGVDSTVAAVLIHKAIGKHLHCIFVDNGLLRKNEFEQVLASYRGMGLNVKGVDAKSQFYEALRGLSDPEKKRKAIGRVFIEVFEHEAHLIQGVEWLGQGTIYPDVIESVSVKGPSVTIKSHHNVGGLPEKMKLKVVEPLNTLFKDEVRKVGKTLGIDMSILGRHPFPGPGLAIRILGEVTPEKVQLLQEVDDIFISALKKHHLYDHVWQAGAILLPIHSVGVMGDERTYEQVVALRAVTSLDGMTADWCHLPYDFLGEVSNQIINNVKGINRVVYDISSKPPATIEWE